MKSMRVVVSRKQHRTRPKLSELFLFRSRVQEMVDRDAVVPSNSSILHLLRCTSPFVARLNKSKRRKVRNVFVIGSSYDRLLSPLHTSVLSIVVRRMCILIAEAEARYLSGLGVARQRRAIIQGLQESVGSFSSEVHGATPKDVMDILLLSQYFDTLASVGANSLILEHDPATVAALRQSVGSSFLTGAAATMSRS